MATAKPAQGQSMEAKMKSRIQGQVDKVNNSADLLSGRKQPDGKLFKKHGQKQEEGNMDKFVKNLKEEFNTVLQEKDKPFQGVLGNVQIQRVIRTGKAESNKTASK